jgi:preprotein translocase subunit SecA
MLRSLTSDLNVNVTRNREVPQNSRYLLKVFDLEEQNISRLLEAIKGGIPHLVLNARKHDEESKLIEKAGAFGAVTIATNMAGRGVDIKLGGELPEDVNANISLVLENLGHNPYEMTLEEKSSVLEKIAADKLSVVRAESVKTFLEYVENMQKVKDLGGLHVIGSERYESRRIDNQLRGRAARQGDPGSSRYYLSLEDDLMRLFGGAQVENMWKRVFFDDDQPLEMKLIGRIVEGSQERVEGANFDARKHVLEYDDVLNTQRQRIYEQRDRVFVKEDLSEDVLDMLRTELQPRIESGLADEEGPWRLMAYLDQIQPSFTHEGVVYPSYPMREVINEFQKELSGKAAVPENVGPALLSMAEKAMQAHKDHVLRGTETLLDKAQESMDRQIEERLDTLETFLDSLSDYEDPSMLPAPKEMLLEISNYVHIPLRLTAEQLQRLPEGDEDVIEELKNQVRSVLMAVTLKRILGSLERRLGAVIELDLSKLITMQWVDVYDFLLRTVIGFFDSQISRLLGPNGQISQDLQNIFSHLSGAEEDLSMERSLAYLMSMVQGSRLAFDKRTHKKVQKRYVRFTYHYLAAKLIEDLPAENVSEEILEHLEGALQALIQTSGNLEWSRLTQQFDAALDHLDETVKTLIRERMGSEHFEKISSTPFSELSAEDAALIRLVLGERLRNEAYREILVRVISSQWIDYLTQVEALRISIGMEAYAQRDPLIQYKSRATEMFSELLASIRMGVISRLFIHRVRKDSVVTLDRERAEGKTELEAEISSASEQSRTVPAQSGTENEQTEGKKKRRRRR